MRWHSCCAVAIKQNVAARGPRATGRQTAGRDIPLIEEDAGTEQHAHEADEQEVPNLLCASAHARQQGKVAVVQGQMSTNKSFTAPSRGANLPDNFMSYELVCRTAASSRQTC